jgi:50S ribosomal protein L16 3-hydroxylase
MMQQEILDTLTGSQKEKFLQQTFGRVPFSSPRQGRAYVPLATKEKFMDLFPIIPNKDILVVRNGKLSEERIPDCRGGVEELLERGHSFILRYVNRFDLQLGKMARSFEKELQADVAIHLYLTPGGYFSFGWHYDLEETFIIQTAGQKEYFLRENTVHARGESSNLDEKEFEKETSSLMLGTKLIAGDWLYIPRGWWHVAQAEEFSLSISVGLRLKNRCRFEKLAPRIAWEPKRVRI